MFKVFFTSVYILFFAQAMPLFSLSLRENFQKHALTSHGSFIVTEHQKTLSFLRVYAFEDPYLFLEEINLPAHLLPKKPVDWDAWLKNKAPHHTSWLLYQIDLDQGKILDCYSFSRESFISLSDQQSFLTTLMTLSLEKVPDSERKRIGAASSEGWDTRKIWNPPKIKYGKHLPKPHFTMMRTKWPKDGSQLSGKLIDLYFDQDDTFFPFPYWIEIGDGHNVFKIRAIDTGYSITFPFKHTLKRPPTIHHVSLSSAGLEISLATSSSFKHFQVILSTKEEDEYHTTPFACDLLTKEGMSHLLIPASILKQQLHLRPNTLYSLCILPTERPDFITEYAHPIRLDALIK